MDDESRSPAKTINAMKARQILGQLLEEAYYKGEQFIIERAGRPMAAVVPLSMLEEWQKHHGQPQSSADTNKNSKRQQKQKKV